MAGKTTGLVKGFKATTAVGARLIVKFGAADDAVVPAAAVGDTLIGVSTEIAADVGENCDVQMSGIAEVVYGGAVTRGDWLTSDANGKAVAAAPGAGTNNNVIGRAMASGVLNDIGAVILAPGRIQG